LAFQIGNPFRLLRDLLAELLVLSLQSLKLGRLTLTRLASVGATP
jgi:hypothetical protein